MVTWGLHTARAMKALLAANGRAASVAPPGPLPWIAKGYVQASDVEPVIGAPLTICSVIWSVNDKRMR